MLEGPGEMNRDGLTRILEAFDKVVGAVEGLWTRATAFLMFAIMVIVVVDVCLRYFLNSPLDGSYELITLYLMAALFFLSLSQTLHYDHHVRVDILFRLVSARVRSFMEFIGYCLSIILFALIFIQGLKRTWSDWTTNGIIDGAYLWPTWITSALVPIGVGLLMFRLVQRLTHSGIAAAFPNFQIPKIGPEHWSSSEKQDDPP